MKCTFTEWSGIIAAIESRGNPEAWGDDGMACGRWQEHPCFVQQWIGQVTWSVRATWDDVFQAALLNFFDRASCHGISGLDAAIGFHLHGQPVRASEQDRIDAAEYAARFTAEAQRRGADIS